MRKVVPGLVLAVMTGAATAQTVPVETFSGPVEVAAAPEKIAAFDLAAIDTLAALGIPVDGVPAVTPPAYLHETMEQGETVGTLFEPDFEALAVMAPDLIIAGGRSQGQVEALSRIAPTLDMTIGTDIVADAKDRALAYGELFGREAEAEALIAQLDAAIAIAQADAEGTGDALILLTNGGKVSAYGDDSRFGWLHTTLGLAEAYPDLTAETHGESVSFEFIAEVDPDWIFVIDRGAAIGQEGEAATVTLDNPLVAGTGAGKADRIVYLDSGPLYLAGGGLQSLLTTIGQVTEALEAGAGR